MADTNIDVSLPNAININVNLSDSTNANVTSTNQAINATVSIPQTLTTDVTSPTQALATNVSVPGPQGPAGPRGLNSLINGITGDSISLSGENGIIISSDQSVNTIYVSGNSGYFQDNINLINTNLRITGSTLDNKINSLSGNLTSDYVTKTNGQFSNRPTVNGTGILLSGEAANVDLSSTVKITGDQNISGIKNFYSKPTVNGIEVLLSGEAAELPTTIVYTTGDQIIFGNKNFTNILLSGNPVLTGVDLTPYATIINLAVTGSTLDQKINSLSGYSASIVNLQSTGSNLYSMLIEFSGNLDATYATDSQLYTTGSTLDNKINSLSGWSASAIDLTSTGITLINNLFNTGSTLDTKINSLSGNLTTNYATIINLTSTGSTLNTKINDLSGYVNIQDNTISTNLYNTGNTLNNRINSLSGYTDSQDTTISNNLRTTGSTLDTKINNLSGYVNTQDITISNNLITTGSTLDQKINSLSGAAVLKFDDQIIYGTKYFNEDVYIHNLYVTGDEFIANVTNNFVESPYLLLNLTGGAIDGGIFFVTGSGFTGIDSYGPIIGFDHSNKFKFGIARRSDDLSSLPDIASVQQIEAYSGVANNTFSTIINLYNTGSTLDNKINSLSGWSASAENLSSTGSTLQTNINSLSGSSVLLYGNQLINGTKTFNSGVVINVQPTGTNPALYITGTWNNASQVYSGIALKINDSGSNSSSKLIDLTVNEISMLNLTKGGLLTLYAGGAISVNSAGNFLRGLTIGSDGLKGQPTTSAYLFWPSNNIIEQRNGTNSQQLRVYNTTGTNSGEFGLFGWQNNQLIIGSQATNSGISRNVLLTGNNILASGSNFDISTDGICSASTAFYLKGLGSTAGITTSRGTAGRYHLRDNAGQYRLEISSSTVGLSQNTRLAWGASNGSTMGINQEYDLSIYRDGAGILAQYNGINPQQLRVYNITGTNTGEFSLIGWINSGFVVGPQQTNLGRLRDLTLTGANININASGAFNIFDNTNIAGNLNVTGNIYLSGNPVLTGVDLSPYATVANLTLTGSILDSKIDTLSGWSASAANLISTGSNLYNNIISLSGLFTGYTGNLDATFATDAQLYTTGSTLDGKINSLSGWSASAINLASTGSTLDDKINNLSGYTNSTDSNIVFTTGDQTINGIKSFDIAPIVSGNSLITGNLSNYATIIDLASTGSTLNSNINNLSGYVNSSSSNIVFTTGNQLINGIKTFNSGISIFQPDRFTNNGFSLYTTGTWNDTAISGQRALLTGTAAGRTMTVTAVRSGIISTGQTFSVGGQLFTITGFGPLASGGTGIYILDSSLFRTNESIDARLPFVVSRFDINDVSSDTRSSYIDCRQNGTTKFAVEKNGAVKMIFPNSSFKFDDGSTGSIKLVYNPDGVPATALFIRADSAARFGLMSTMPLAWGSASVEDTFIYRDAAGIVAQRNGTNPQQLRVYNTTGTNSGEFGLFSWQNNNLLIGSQATNSGILRNVVVTGNNVLLSGNNINVTPNGGIGLKFVADVFQTFGNNFVGMYNGNGQIVFCGGTAGNTRVAAIGQYGNTAGIGIAPTRSLFFASSDALAGGNFVGDIYLTRSSAGVINQVSSTTPQQYRIFNLTGTNTGEFGLLGWINSGFVVGPQQTTSGILRNLTLTGANININASGVLNVFDNTNIVGNLTVSGNTTITGHLSAASKSFLINHPTIIGKKLQYGSLESPYHGIRLTDKNKISSDSVRVNLPDYISALVNEDKVNVQLTNINHDKILFVKEVNVNQNNFVVGMNRGWFDKNEYEFYWSFTAERKDIPKLTVEF